MDHFDPLHLGAKSDQCRAFFAAANRRFEHRDLEARKVHVYDGPMTLTPRLLQAAVTAAWAMGAHESTLKEMEREKIVPEGVVRLVRMPKTYGSADQRHRGQARIAYMRKQRKKRAAEAAKGSRQNALNAMIARIGVSESPPGSNGGGPISDWEAYFGFGRVAWCGIFWGFHIERFGGVDVMSDVASVWANYQHGLKSQDPYVSFTSSVKGALPGDGVIIGGPTIHIEGMRKPLADGSALTVGGNTSPGRTGSQVNGGCVAGRHRTDAEIFGVLHMNFPD